MSYRVEGQWAQRLVLLRAGAGCLTPLRSTHVHTHTQAAAAAAAHVCNKQTSRLPQAAHPGIMCAESTIRHSRITYDYICICVTCITHTRTCMRSQIGCVATRPGGCFRLLSTALARRQAWWCWAGCMSWLQAVRAPRWQGWRQGAGGAGLLFTHPNPCLLFTSPSPLD